MRRTQLAHPIPRSDNAQPMRRIDDVNRRASAEHGVTAQIERRRDRDEQAVRIDRADTGPRMRRQQGAETRLDRFHIEPTDIRHTFTVGIHHNPLEHL